MGIRAPRSTVVLPLVATACAAPPAPPAGLRAADPPVVLRALLAVEKTRNVAVAPFLLHLIEDAHANLAVRAQAAALLLEFGFPQGRDFCLALLDCGLPAAAPADRRWRIPPTDAPAFAREIAQRALAQRLAEAGLEAPRYDVNFGAPDLARAARAYRRLFRRLPPQPPDAAAATIPRSAPAGYEDLPWAALRRRLLTGGRR